MFQLLLFIFAMLLFLAVINVIWHIVVMIVPWLIAIAIIALTVWIIRAFTKRA